MNLEEQQYLDLLQDILDNGIKKTIFSDNGKTLPTIDKNKYYEVDKDSKYLLSCIGGELYFDLSNGQIPLYTTKAVYYPAAFKEMLWFLNSRGNVSELHRSKVTIWNGWAYKKYLKETLNPLSYNEFVEEYLTNPNSNFYVNIPYSDMTNWEYSNGKKTIYLNQTKYVIDSIKKAPDRKSYVVSAWNPTRAYGLATECGRESVCLVACHCEHQILIHGGKLILRVTIRSNDMPLGNPFNVAQYGLLAHMYAKCLGIEAGTLLVQITDRHIYSDQIDEVKNQIANQSKGFPTLTIKDRNQQYLEDFDYSDFLINNYYPESSIRMPLTVVGGF